MAEYYLISQLPSLDGISESAPLSITSERFEELCERFLGKKALAQFKKLTLAPSIDGDDSLSPLVEGWTDGERKLRIALAKLRAEKLNKSFSGDVQGISPELMQTARTAVEFESPMEAELFLNKHRLELLETLRPMDSFSEEYVFYYGLKLMLIERIRKFDAEIGEAAYKNIYSSIMNNDKTEVIQ